VVVVQGVGVARSFLLNGGDDNGGGNMDSDGINNSF
jgi:hypothetical protein